MFNATRPGARARTGGKLQGGRGAVEGEAGSPMVSPNCLLFRSQSSYMVP